MDTQPLVSCIMPTYNRRAFVPHAIEYFFRQDYPNKELIVIDDGTDPVSDLMPDDQCIRYIRLDKRATIGTKRNLACEYAHGLLIAHWDDDDWHAAHRLRYQVNALIFSGKSLCGINRLLFWDMDRAKAWEYDYSIHQRLWLSGSTLVYRRDFWCGHRFSDVNVGEDARFVWSASSRDCLVLDDFTFHVGIIHRNNVSPKRMAGSYWICLEDRHVQNILGADLTRLSDDQGVHVAARALLYGSCDKRSTPMIIVAQKDDLGMAEFLAFNSGVNLPWMRRWELPFALFQSQLANTMAILDCTINPSGFHERLGRLYPHTVYRHWNPIQNGQFVPPLGVPDESFDRVICVNTLEHLLRHQREELVRDMSRKLKPGGRLVLTSDYYYDASWEDQVFLRTGLMRADRAEVFNGYNKVTPAEWVRLCQPWGLSPVAEICKEPESNDHTLYVNQPPHPHACIGGVFAKDGIPQTVDLGRFVLLALLMWNTRDISVDSVRAYLREARLLRRLGQRPILCLCDNGSTDGTPEALRGLEPELAEFPYKLILNRENLGNSTARNQIIEYSMDCGADYVLFMDGDIEIVPFSSFAMLRYMETHGHRLGCIGADSAGQSPSRSQVSPCLFSIEKVDTTNLVAWTQYGMFRRTMFEEGIRFDDGGPFHGPGWGFEDNDLAFQMEMKGYVNQRFYGMTYLHRAARSSIRIMRAKGIDARLLYEKRKQYVIDKWSSIPHVNNGPLTYVRRVVMPAM
jgi:glycosyltransferase involved in cell wall biosynthesis